jgi:hypothetical protein
LAYRDLGNIDDAIFDLDWALKIGLDEESTAVAEAALAELNEQLVVAAEADQADETESPVTDPSLDYWLDVPIMPGAWGMVESDDFMAYSTNASVAEVMSFYEETMTAEGWSLAGQEESEEEIGGAFTTLYTLVYVRESGLALIFVAQMPYGYTTVGIGQM